MSGFGFDIAGIKTKAKSIAYSFGFGTPVIKPEEGAIHPGLSQAIGQQESGNKPGQKGAAGELGVMQVMPDTAKETTAKHDIPLDEDALLNDERYGRKVGDLVMSDLLKEFDDSLPLALAAYNAGPKRVKEWIKKHGHPREVGEKNWIKSIPFPKTRNYVGTIMDSLPQDVIEVYERPDGSYVKSK